MVWKKKGNCVLGTTHLFYLGHGPLYLGHVVILATKTPLTCYIVYLGKDKTIFLVTTIIITLIKTLLKKITLPKPK